MNHGEFKDRLNKFLNFLISQYEEGNPQWLGNTLLRVIQDAVSSLKTHLEDPKEKETSWNHRYIELRYPVLVTDLEDLKEAEPAPISLLENLQNPNEKTLSNLILEHKILTLFWANSRHLVLIRKGDKLHLLKSNLDSIKNRNLLARLKKIPVTETGQIEIDLLFLRDIVSELKPFELDISRKVTDSKGKKRRAKGSLSIQFLPLIIEPDLKRAYFPLQVGLEVNGYKASRWSDKDWADFWDNLLKALIKVGGFPQVEEDTELAKPTIIPVKEPLHKQPRSFLKTVASLVGRDTQQSLFSLPTIKRAEDAPEIKDLKEAISKQTAITGSYLIQLWQKKKGQDDWLVIDNLTEVAGPLKQSTHRLKLYLIGLGGYQYPVIKLDKDKKTLTISNDKLCHIEFDFSLNDHETENMDLEDLKVGTRYLYFIKDRPVKTVRFKPTETMVRELREGKGLGNILVSDSFVAFCLGLSDMAYKLLCFTASNRPRGFADNGIGFDKLIKPLYLNLERQVKTRGRPRVIRTIVKGLEELQAKGHLKFWMYDEKTERFSWEYTDMIIKHKELLPPANPKVPNQSTLQLYDET